MEEICLILVSKRNRTIVPFDKEKIINAINAAFLEVDGELYEDDTAKDIADEIEDYFKYQDGNGCSVEEIQDMVEEYLMRSERKDVARAYIRYRYKKEVARNYQHDFIDAIREKLEATDVKN